MADSKITDLSDGGAVVDTDELVAARSGSDVKIAGSQVLRSPATFITRVAGDLALTNDGTWRDVPTIGDLTIGAQTDDLLLVIMSALIDQNAFVDVELVNSGNYVGNGASGSSQGIASWFYRTSTAQPMGGMAFYKVVAGDISGGNVVLRLRYSTTAASKFFADSVVGPFQFGVINLKH